MPPDMVFFATERLLVSLLFASRFFRRSGLIRFIRFSDSFFFWRFFFGFFLRRFIHGI